VLVFFLTKLLADDLVENKRLRRQEVSSGPLHDIGKICVPLSVLKKTSPLTRTERGLLEHHAVAGYVLLSYYYRDCNHLAARIARDHHERKDGSGYPRGMLLEDQLVEIVAVADIYDALISPRPYRPKSYENRAALEELTAMADRGALNPHVVKALIAHNRKTKPHFTECIVSKEKRAQPPKKNFYGTTKD
jgi:two-component system, response regulator RpfG